MNPAGAQIQVLATDRVALIGKTQSGKTFIVRVLVGQFPRVVVIDPKPDMSIDDWGLMDWDEKSQKLLRDGAEVQVRAKIPDGYGGDPMKFWEDVFARCYEAGDVMIYVDEAYGVLNSQYIWDHPEMLAIWTRGAGRRVGAIVSSQRPTHIPGFFLTEAEHFFIFRLRRESDRRLIAQNTVDEVEGRIPAADKHGFWYYNEAEEHAIYVPRLDLPGDTAWKQIIENSKEVENA